MKGKKEFEVKYQKYAFNNYWGRGVNAPKGTGIVEFRRSYCVPVDFCPTHEKIELLVDDIASILENKEISKKDKAFGIFTLFDHLSEKNNKTQKRIDAVNKKI